MNQPENSLVKEIKSSSLFIVAALSPNFLISVICVFLYLANTFPEIKEPVSNAIANLLRKAGISSFTEGAEQSETKGAK